MNDMTMALGATPPDGRGAHIRTLSRPIRARREIVARVHLARANVLRVHDGRATIIRALSGMLWITEEGSVKDTVLAAGEVHRIENQGMALVLAHHAGRVVLEVPPGDRGPRMLEIVMRDGDSVHRVLPVAGSTLRSPVAAAIAVVRRALASAMRGLSRRAMRPREGPGPRQYKRRLRVPYY